MANNSTSSFKTALILLRIPFSVFLMPFFWLALSNIDNRNGYLIFQVFLILHLLVYPSSNGLNSFYDNDTDSIGGLEKPPLPNKELLFLSLVLMSASTLWAFIIDFYFGLFVLIYHLVSTAYSHPAIRLKASPFWSTLSVVFFQGGFTYVMVLLGFGASLKEIIHPANLTFAFTCSLLLIGSYPLTQIYQHQSDSIRGDKTLSIYLGINGTFKLAQFVFPIGALGMILAYAFSLRFYAIPVFLLAGLPAAIYLHQWKRACKADPSQANFKKTMKMNKISSLSLSGGFILILLLRMGII